MDGEKQRSNDLTDMIKAKGLHILLLLGRIGVIGFPERCLRLYYLYWQYTNRS